ncbi:MAG: nuclear transport factor 2 family protein [Thermoguttaceae bacterium]
MRRFTSSLLLLLLCVPSGFSRGADDLSQQAAVRSAFNAYTRACETSDFELLSSVFSHDPDIVLINVGETSRSLVGWPSVAELYQGLFSATTGVRMQHSNVSIKMLGAGTAACLTCSQQIDWVVDGNRYGHERIRVTCVLEKQQGKWRIVHGHWSLPSTEEPKRR